MTNVLFSFVNVSIDYYIMFPIKISHFSGVLDYRYILLLRMPSIQSFWRVSKGGQL